MSIYPSGLYEDTRGLARASVGSVSRAPATTADGVYATSPDSGLGVEYGPMPWPRDGAFLPSVGDEVLMVFPGGNQASNPWVVQVRRNG